MTIAIVALVLMAVLQGMEGAKISAYHTKQRKTAYELGQVLMGDILTGQYREELDSGMNGSFAEQDEPDFLWEVALGEDVFESEDGTYDNDDERPFDNYAARREWEDDNRDDDDDDEEEIEEPFEKIRLRVTFPPLKEFDNEIVLETWAPWEQIYGVDEEEDELEGGTNVGGPVGQNSDGGGDEGNR